LFYKTAKNHALGNRGQLTLPVAAILGSVDTMYAPSESVASGMPAPKAAGLAGRHNSNITAWDNSRLPSEGSARGDINNYESRSAAPQSMPPPAVMPSITLFVFFQQGKVSDFKLER
jgi:hypothetical protein